QDGHIDWAVTNSGDNAVGVALGLGFGFFGKQLIYSVGSNPIAMTCQDFNSDGQLDLIVVNYGNNSIGVLLGNTDGTFQSQ
ncbi:unnamed protein product, partial [Rotaria magnacalcarata]